MTRSKTIKALREIRNSHPKKKLMAEDVVEAAQDPSSPLHSAFQWDDSKAARAYRLVQARHLISEVNIFIDDKQERSTPAYVSLIADRKNGGGYRAIEQVLSSAVLRRQMLETAIAEFEAIKQRFDKMQELSGIWKAVAKVKAKVCKGTKAA